MIGIRQMLDIVKYLYNYKKADDKFSSAFFKKKIKSKLYHIENSKTRGQTVKI